MPGTRLGWGSAALAVAYVCLLLGARTLSGTVSWGQTGALLLVMLMELCEWSAGITGLVSVVEKHERSVVVWIAMLPAAYALITMLYNALRLVLVSQ